MNHIVFFHPSTRIEPTPSRVGSYMLIVFSLFPLGYFTPLNFPSPQFFLSVTFAFIFSNTIPPLPWGSNRRWLDSLSQNAMGDCSLNNHSIQDEIDRWHANAPFSTGDVFLLKPYPTRGSVALFVAIGLVSFSLAFVSIFNFDSAVWQILFTTLTVDAFLTGVWYCTIWADTFSLLSADATGFKAGSIRTTKLKEYSWNEVSVHAFDIGLELYRTTLFVADKHYTVILRKDTLMKIAYFMSPQRDTADS